MLVIPSKEKMLDLFQKLCKAVSTLRTDGETVKNFSDSVMSIFKRVTQERLEQVSETFERAQGLDLLESFM